LLIFAGTLRLALLRVNPQDWFPAWVGAAGVLLIRCASMGEVASMPLACPACAARMPESAAFCPGCGVAMKAPERVRGKVGGLSENIAGALAYLTFIPAVVLLVVQPFNKNQFVRFHAIQNLLLTAAALAIAAALKVAGYVLVLVPIAGPLLAVLLYAVAALGGLCLWLVLVVKALQGESFKLPALGNFAEHYAGSL
jgi:uncharacterized membrane protein